MAYLNDCLAVRRCGTGGMSSSQTKQSLASYEGVSAVAVSLRLRTDLILLILPASRRVGTRGFPGDDACWWVGKREDHSNVRRTDESLLTGGQSHCFSLLGTDISGTVASY